MEETMSTSLRENKSFDFINSSQSFQSSLQNMWVLCCVFLGHVFENTATDGLEPYFLKTWLKLFV